VISSGLERKIENYQSSSYPLEAWLIRLSRESKEPARGGASETSKPVEVRKRFFS
jgi:hypothetical protein